MSEKEKTNFKIALASTAIEGYEITEQTVSDCMRLLSGELSVSDLAAEIHSRHSV